MESQLASLTARAASRDAHVSVLCSDTAKAEFREVSEINVGHLATSLRMYVRVAANAVPTQAVMVAVLTGSSRTISDLASAIEIALDRYQDLGFPDESQAREPHRTRVLRSSVARREFQRDTYLLPDVPTGSPRQRHVE